MKEVFVKRSMEMAETRDGGYAAAAKSSILERIEKDYVQRGIFPLNIKKITYMSYGNLVLEEKECVLTNVGKCLGFYIRTIHQEFALINYRRITSAVIYNEGRCPGCNRFIPWFTIQAGNGMV